MVATSENFGIKTLCKICYLEEDTTNHLMKCIFFKLKIPELCQTEVILDDIFKKNIGKMNEVAKLFEKILRKKEEWKDEEQE